MNKQERIARGLGLIEDAKFVYDKLIPVASRENRWNIVVFEAYRASELLVKGIIYASGHEPLNVHGLDTVVSRFCKILEQNREQMAYVYSITDPTGDSYFLRFIEGRLELIKKVAGYYCELDSSALQNPYIAPKLKRDGSTISIQQGNKTVLSVDDSAITGIGSYARKIPNQPPEERVEILREIVNTLLQTRTEAFYRQREFTKDEADKAIKNLQSVFKLSRIFEVTERI